MKAEWASLRNELNAIELVDSDHDPSPFERYIHWLYFQTIPIPDETRTGDKYKMLAQCYILGEELMDIDFKNYVLNGLIEITVRNVKFPRDDVVRII